MTMSHDEAFAELDAVAFDVLEPTERDGVLAHVKQCQICRAELDVRRAMVADLAFAAPLSVDTSAGGRSRIRNRLTARAAADARADIFRTTPPSSMPTLLYPTPSTAPHLPRYSANKWWAIAASVFFVASGGLFAAAWTSRSDLSASLREASAAREVALRRVDSLADAIGERDSMIAGLAGRDVSVMTLTSSAAREPYARMFWDRSRNRWTFIAANMPALRPGRTYQLWLVTANAKISAGTFVPRGGSAVVVATYALADPLEAVAVTEERAGGAPQPTGEPVIAAAAR